MKIAVLALALIALSAIALFFALSKRPEPPPETLVAALDETRPQGEAPHLQPLPVPDASVALFERLNQVLSKLDNLEVGVREARTEITLRSQEHSRTPVTAYPANATSRLGDQDLDNLRAIVREELANEAWKRRQGELVDIARHLAVQLPLEAKTIDPMIEVLCTNGKTLFDLERELSESNHERGLAKRRAPDFRLARRRLRDDLGSIYRDDELAARVFLHVASHGEVAALQLNRESLLATEKEWLR